MKVKAIFFALIAALFFAVNVPVSKFLLKNVEPAFMASFLYLGAGVGMFLLYFFDVKSSVKSEFLSLKDLPFVVGMVILDIAAPIFLMLGINYGTSSNASLLGNFEIVATTIFAFVFFKEAVSIRLCLAIALITLSGMILTFEGVESFNFSYGSALVLLATICWGFENNCTRKISSKNTFEIVIIKGIFSGLGALIIAFIAGETLPKILDVISVMSLGFVAYGLSIFFYVKAQNIIGAAKTSAYYSVAPFAGALISFLSLHEELSGKYLLALLIMAAGSVLVVIDTLIHSHIHEHEHFLIHTHGGSTHTHKFSHSHIHNHYFSQKNHKHFHSETEMLNLEN